MYERNAGLFVSRQGVKLSIQAAALTPVTNTVVQPIVPADFSQAFGGNRTNWRKVSFQGVHYGFA